MDEKAKEQRPLSLLEERRLVERLKEGDTRALEPIWRAYATTVYRSAIYPVLPLREQAEEVLQNTFLKAYERIGGYTWQDKGLLPWLKTIARNLAMDAHRKRQRTHQFCQGYGQYVEDAEVGATTTHERPDKALFEQERRQLTRTRVRAVLDSGKLNERYQRAIELRLFEELEREQCAALMEVKVGTFDVLFHRALKRFEVIYRELYGAPP